jgi:hypothetical protein
MKIVKYISKAIEFLKSFNIVNKSNTLDQGNLELTYTKFGLISKKDTNTGKTSNSLLSQMYSEENESLFI